MAKVSVDTWRTAFFNIIPHGYLQGLRYDDRQKGLANALNNSD
jgi:hypothetical protein